MTTIETISQARRVLADEGFVDDLVADGPQLRVASSGRTYAPAELAVARMIRLRGITTPEDEAILEPGQVLVAVCSHDGPAAVEDVLERHGGDLLLRPRRP